jgi:hypothetical protein
MKSLTCIPLLVATLAVTLSAQNNLDTTHISFRVEYASVIRGPEAYGEDNHFSEIEYQSGKFRGFIANECISDPWNCTHAVDGTSPTDMSAPYPSSDFHADVLNPNVSGSPTWAPCGLWLNGTLSYGGTLYGFIHGEDKASGDTDCSDYAKHHKSMTQATTPTGANAGLSWSGYTEVISSTKVTSGESGEGDCTPITDSTYAYLFCRRPWDIAAAVARTPLSTLSSPNWQKYCINDSTNCPGSTGWSGTFQNGLTGNDTPLYNQFLKSGQPSDDKLGGSTSYWSDQGWLMLLNTEDAAFGGLKASFTALSNLQTNSIAFTTLSCPQCGTNAGAPLMPEDGYYWQDNPTHNLYAYPVAMGASNGGRTWTLVGASNNVRTGQFLLTYTLVPPSNTMTQRYLIMRNVTVSVVATTPDPQVGIDIARWLDSTDDQRYTTTQAPVWTPWPATTFEKDLGAYLATVSVSQGQQLTKILECVNPTWPTNHPDILLTNGSCDTGYSETTIAGYVFPSPTTNPTTVEIFRCHIKPNSPDPGQGTHYVSTDPNCTENGTIPNGELEWSLGYALTK